MRLKRKAYDKLLHWKTTAKGSSAMLIEGARRVGKSYLAQDFVKNEYASFLYLDFANLEKEILDVFENESHDLDLFFMKLETFYGVQLKKRDSCIIFDEVQMYPKARQMIKYLVADGRYDYIETGSLISIKRNIENIVIPSEEDWMQLNPLDFEEFLEAMEETRLLEYIQTCFSEKKTAGRCAAQKGHESFPTIYDRRWNAPIRIKIFRDQKSQRSQYRQAENSSAVPTRYYQIRPGL